MGSPEKDEAGSGRRSGGGDEGIGRRVRVREKKGLGLVFNMSRHGDRLAEVLFIVDVRANTQLIKHYMEGIYLMWLGS